MNVYPIVAKKLDFEPLNFNRVMQHPVFLH